MEKDLNMIIEQIEYCQTLSIDDCSLQISGCNWGEQGCYYDTASLPDIPYDWYSENIFVRPNNSRIWRFNTNQASNAH